ncbi:MAG: formate dehydrogenase accessory protein FdhE [candidate division NC10 bacterium]|nr:formate dehydrogenase accessory protein FdhE [candidate division NC10 bacterium]
MTEETVAESQPGLEEILGCLEALLEFPSVSEAYVRFRIDLLKGQRAVREALAAAPASPTAPHGGSAVSPTTSMLGPEDVAFDAGLLRALFEAICAAAAAHGRRSGDLEALGTALKADPDVITGLARAAAFGPDLPHLEALARQYGVAVDAVLFVGRALAAPFVAETVRRITPGTAGPGRGTPLGGHCGICGSPPSVARLRREDGKRLLTCGLCGTEWEFERLACPWCNSQDAAVLTILRADEAEPRWIEACERCRGYVKTVDERRLPVGGVIIPVVEETATLHLDLLAEREGYIRRLPYVLSG